MKQEFDVIIIGGSYAGLSAAMTLGRAICKVLIIDSGLPCNRQTPHSHNLITRDGETPAAIAAIAREQVLKYPSVKFAQDKAIDVQKRENGFVVDTISGKEFTAAKILFTTGLKDELPDIPGFSECWGISVVHCPYCHGYEIKNERTGILANGDMAFEFARLIHNWTQDLTLFTNGPVTLSEEQIQVLHKLKIDIVEKTISAISHTEGVMSHLVFADNTVHPLTALYARVPFRQHSTIPQSLGCELTEAGHIKVDGFQQTTVPGVYAAGDCTIMFRSLPVAIASGTQAGAFISKDLFFE